MNSKPSTPHSPVSPQAKEKLYEYARKWQDLLGLGRWRLTPSKKPSNAMAEIKFDKDNSHKLAALLVGNDWKSVPVNDETLEITALHEVLHVMLYEFKEACREEPYNEARQLEREHELIAVLEKLLYELWHCKHVELSETVSPRRSKNKRTLAH